MFCWLRVFTCSVTGTNIHTTVKTKTIAHQLHVQISDKTPPCTKITHGKKQFIRLMITLGLKEKKAFISCNNFHSALISISCCWFTFAPCAVKIGIVGYAEYDKWINNCNLPSCLFITCLPHILNAHYQWVKLSMHITTQLHGIAGMLEVEEINLAKRCWLPPAAMKCHRQHWAMEQSVRNQNAFYYSLVFINSYFFLKKMPKIFFTGNC